MKKTLVALSVLAAAANVNAGELYATDASKVSLKGEIDAYVVTSDTEKATLTNSSDAGKQTREELDPNAEVWAKIQLDAEHKMNEDLTVFGSFEIETASNTDHNAKFDDIYVGVKSDSWAAAIGEVSDVADSLNALEKGDITNEGQYFGTAGGHRSESKGHGIVFKADLADSLVLVLDMHTESDKDKDNTIGASLDWTINDMFTIGGAFVSGEQAEDVDYRVGGVSASMTAGGFMVAATYAQFEGVNSFGLFGSSVEGKVAAATIGGNTSAETISKSEDYLYTNGDAYGVAVQYTIDKTRLYATYDVMGLDEFTVGGADANGDTTNLVVGVDYALMDNLTVFTEYQTADTSNDFSGASSAGKIGSGAGLDADAYYVGAYYTF